MSDNEPLPREADVPVKSRTSSINWNAKPWNKHIKPVIPRDQFPEEKQIGNFQDTKILHKNLHLIQKQLLNFAKVRSASSKLGHL